MIDARNLSKPLGGEVADEGRPYHDLPSPMCVVGALLVRRDA